MKYTLPALFLLLLAVGLVLLRAEPSAADAPELFGTASGWQLRAGSMQMSYVSGWGTWLVLERFQARDHSHCVIVPLTRTVGDARAPIACEKWYRGERGKFGGFIEYRGHPRKFCGAQNTGSLPARCMEDRR